MPARSAFTRTTTNKFDKFPDFLLTGTDRLLGKTSGVSIKELYRLFPTGPAKTAAKIAGIPKPRGCI